LLKILFLTLTFSLERANTNCYNDSINEINYQSILNYDARDLQIWETGGDKKLSRQKRNFGGREPIDYPKAVNASFFVAGWVAQGCEAFSDINFHLLGYTALGKVLEKVRLG
jgi:hypothetical protein